MTGGASTRPGDALLRQAAADVLRLHGQLETLAAAGLAWDRGAHGAAFRTLLGALAEQARLVLGDEAKG